MGFFYSSLESPEPDYDGQILHNASDFAMWWIQNKKFAHVPGAPPALFDYSNEDSIELLHYMNHAPKTHSSIETFETAEIAANDRCIGNNYTECPSSLAFIGGTDGPSIDSLQIFASARNILHVHPSTQNPHYTKRPELKTLYRMMPNSGYEAKVILRFIKRMGWKHISVLVASDKEDSAYFLDQMEHAGHMYDIKVQKSSVYGVKKVEGQDYDEVAGHSCLAEIKKKGYRVIVAHGGERSMIPLLKEADQIGMIGNGYVWIGTSHWTATTSLIERLASQDPKLLDLVDGVIGISPVDVQAPVEPCLACSGAAKEQALAIPEGGTDNYGYTREYLLDLSGRFENASGSFCLYLLWEKSYFEGLIDIPPPPRSYLLQIGLMFDTILATAHAISKMAEKRWQCKANQRPARSELCRSLRTIHGMRSQIIYEFNNTNSGLEGYLGTLTPNRMKEMTKNYRSINLRKDMFERKLRGDPDCPHPFEPVGILNPHGEMHDMSQIHWHGGKTEIPGDTNSDGDRQTTYATAAVDNTKYVYAVVAIVPFLGCLFYYLIKKKGAAVASIVQDMITEVMKIAATGLFNLIDLVTDLLAYMYVISHPDLQSFVIPYTVFIIFGGLGIIADGVLGVQAIYDLLCSDGGRDSEIVDASKYSKNCAMQIQGLIVDLDDRAQITFHLAKAQHALRRCLVRAVILVLKDVPLVIINTIIMLGRNEYSNILLFSLMVNCIIIGTMSGLIIEFSYAMETRHKLLKLMLEDDQTTGSSSRPSGNSVGVDLVSLESKLIKRRRATSTASESQEYEPDPRVQNTPKRSLRAPETYVVPNLSAISDNQSGKQNHHPPIGRRDSWRAVSLKSNESALSSRRYIQEKKLNRAERDLSSDHGFAYVAGDRRDSENINTSLDSDV
eukprot:CAMPEP_0197521138 /NCGR_PEP_ID=MMETSP1318-20131121/6427_1 /TAXON_ID=552666 /ORGANISM="Partenskyella glossopodia, Strain RCC365" /LENGTH=898 /DNA_ID=CAMNT_0043072987 /DNA_START=223 /DNA_END=2919 /DNA_ORIENTATION=-